MAGYRVYQNEKLLVNEKILTKDKHIWESKKLKKGSYQYNIYAITKSGLLSEISEPIFININ